MIYVKSYLPFDKLRVCFTSINDRTASKSIIHTSNKSYNRYKKSIFPPINNYSLYLFHQLTITKCKGKDTLEQKQMLLGSFLCLLAVTAWGFMFPVMASALQFIDPFFFTTLRYGSAAIIFLILLLITEGKTSLRLEKEHFLYSFTGQSVSRGMVFSFSTDSNLPDLPEQSMQL